MKQYNVHIDLGDRSYDITIGSSLLSSIDKYLPFDIADKKFFLITDTNVELYSLSVQKLLQANGAEFCDVLTFPFGEATKSYDSLKKAHDWLLKNNVHRNSVIMAIGGGVIGDLAGFAAATALRGVYYVQVPTSLLAQVDSSVGGKTGINTYYGKNLVGAFYQPVAVIADTDTLQTLPKRELLAGYAEIVKYGLIDDLDFFEWLEENAKSVLELNKAAVSYAIEASCRAKAAIVEADEREGGKRALLNLGHTFGHALEAAAGYDGSLLHGEGVAIGIIMAYELSLLLGHCTQGDVDRVRAHFKSVGLPVDIGSLSTSIDDLLAIISRDKKAVDNKMVFVIPSGIGKSFISKDVPKDMVVKVLEQFILGE